MHKSLKQYRLQLARQLIGYYCSRRRAGRHGGAIASLPLQHFPLNDDSDPQEGPLCKVYEPQSQTHRLNVVLSQMQSVAGLSVSNTLLYTLLHRLKY